MKKVKKMAFGGMSGPGGFGGPMGGMGRGGMGGPRGAMPVPQVLPSRLPQPTTTAETFIPRPTVSGAPAPDYGTMNQMTARKKGGSVKAKPKKMASGGKVSSASKRADGVAKRGKTKGRMV